MNATNKPLIVFLVILSFLTGIIGGISGIAIVSGSPTLQKSLGMDSSATSVGFQTPDKIENITVKEDSSIVSAVKKASASVVSVTFSKDVQVINPFSSPYLPDQTVQQQQGGGSGFIITSEGLIATNKHVADLDGAKYTVITSEGKKYDAKVLAKDPAADFAILKIDAKGLPVVDFGDSDNLDVGQRVIAIGNALGEFQNTVTVGVLSGKERTLTASDGSGTSTEILEGLLQTDAAINSGNSGGPLVNLKGQVIGINTATAAKGEAEGLGFAIPINSLKSAIESIKKTGKIIRPYLGIRYVVVDKKIAAVKGMKSDKGILIIGDSTQSAIVKDSPADKAGLKEGDVITKVNNEDVGQEKSLARVLTRYQPSDEITLKIIRDASEIDIVLRLGESPTT